MFRQDIKWVDFNGNERTEPAYFNITKSEILASQLKTGGTWAKKLKDVSASNDPKRIMEVFEEFLDSTYGEKSDDGLYHDKSKEALARFKSTGAYDELYYKMCTDSDFALSFVNAVMPLEIREAVAKANADMANNEDSKDEQLDPIKIAPVLE